MKSIEVIPSYCDIYGPLDSRESEYTQKFQAALAGKRHVRYCGALKPEEVYGVLADYKFFINPSSTEASPVAVMEAGACGLYLYLSDIVGHRNLGFPDVHYFKYDHIEIPVHDTRTRSTLNVVWHKENLSIESNLRRYEEVYNSFN